MQTFLPYPDFRQSLECLDMRRLGKQRVEAFQLIKGHLDPLYPWGRHPAGKMWLGHTDALMLYYNLSIEVWIARGYKNTMLPMETPKKPSLPAWVGDNAFHDAHKSNLLRKDPIFYGQYGWDVPHDLPYIWPLTAPR